MKRISSEGLQGIIVLIENDTSGNSRRGFISIFRSADYTIATKSFEGDS